MLDDDWTAYLRDHRRMLIDWMVERSVDVRNTAKYRHHPRALLRSMGIDLEYVEIIVWLNDLDNPAVGSNLTSLLIPGPRWNFPMLMESFKRWRGLNRAGA